jgi:anti-sigma B factor antagonist
MEIHVLTNGSIYILDIHGDMNLADSNRLKDLVMKMIEKKVERFIINTGSMKSIDSNGIGAFIFISSTLKKLGLKLAITNSEAVEQVMDKVKLAGYFPLYKNVDEAIQKLSKT